MNFEMNWNRSCLEDQCNVAPGEGHDKWRTLELHGKLSIVEVGDFKSVAIKVDADL